MNLKQRKGITLVALVVTIIILLILASVAISSIMNSGIIDKAKIASEEYANATANETKQIENMANEIDRIIENNDIGIITSESLVFTPANSNWNVTNVKEALDYLYNN